MANNFKDSMVILLLYSFFIRDAMSDFVMILLLADAFGLWFSFGGSKAVAFHN